MWQDNSYWKPWVKTTFKGTHNLNCKISWLLGDFDFGFSPCLGEAIASNNIDITKIYIDRDKKIEWIRIDESCYKINDYFVL